MAEMNLQKMADAVRILSADAIEKAKSGHPGAALGMADIATVLWSRFLRFDASCPNWPDRDRVVFSNGHASALVYSILYLTGTDGVSLDDLKSFRQLGSRTPGHPERGVTPGVDFSTGPLGQGLAGAVGLALAERVLQARFGTEYINHKTYCFVGDGCLMEGISEEVISLAGLWQLNNLIVLWDDNQITIDGKTDIATKTNMKKRFQANGWRVISCNGHKMSSIEKALEKAQKSTKPILIDCHTVIGCGAPNKQNSPKVHGAPLGSEEIQALRRQLNWNKEPFFVPDDVLASWRAVGVTGEGDRLQWELRTQDDDFKKTLNTVVPETVFEKLKTYRQTAVADKTPIATRKASSQVLEILLSEIPFLVGGSADLGASNLTKTGLSKTIMPPDYDGNYINYGVRELGMAGIANGLAAHQGILPYTSTFFSFSDYMKPAMRLGALMGLKQFYVLTHDSLGAGEDGPTHQPIEQLLSLRAMPDIQVFRPADAVETAECYETILQSEGPACLVLSRQNLAPVRMKANENLSQKGGYVLAEATHKRQATLIATGSEVSLATEAKKLLADKGVDVAVVSMPCLEIFNQQSVDYQKQVLGNEPRIVVEAAASDGWYKIVGDTGAVVGVDVFGASGPGDEVLKHYGFTPEHVVEIVLSVI